MKPGEWVVPAKGCWLEKDVKVSPLSFPSDPNVPVAFCDNKNRQEIVFLDVTMDGFQVNANCTHELCDRHLSRRRQAP